MIIEQGPGYPDVIIEPGDHVFADFTFAHNDVRLMHFVVMDFANDHVARTCPGAPESETSSRHKFAVRTRFAQMSREIID